MASALFYYPKKGPAPLFAPPPTPHNTSSYVYTHTAHTLYYIGKKVPEGSEEFVGVPGNHQLSIYVCPGLKHSNFYVIYIKYFPLCTHTIFLLPLLLYTHKQSRNQIKIYIAKGNSNSIFNPKGLLILVCLCQHWRRKISFEPTADTVSFPFFSALSSSFRFVADVIDR